MNSSEDAKRERYTHYIEVFSEHIKHAEERLKVGDYLDAAEKVWGAFSALINYYSLKHYGSMYFTRRTYFGEELVL